MQQQVQIHHHWIVHTIYSRGSVAQHSVHTAYATDFTLVCTSGGTWHTFCCTICRNSRLLRAQAQARKQSETHTTLNDNGWRTENDKKYHLQIGLKHINMYILAFGRWLFHRSTFATQHNTTQHTHIHPFVFRTLQ